MAPLSVAEGLSNDVIREADFQAKTKAETITPTITAIAKSSRTVTTVTKTITKASDFGTTNNNFIEFHAKVPTTTINITPTKAAIGISSINEEVYKIKIKRNRAAATPAILVRPPDFTFIIDCPIIAQPPIPPKTRNCVSHTLC